MLLDLQSIFFGRKKNRSKKICYAFGFACLAAARAPNIIASEMGFGKVKFRIIKEVVSMRMSKI